MCVCVGACLTPTWPRLESTMKALARIEKYIGQILKAKEISQGTSLAGHTDMTHCALECLKRRQGQKDEVQ